MRIALDARYLRGEYSGIGVYSEGLIKALGRLDQSNEYIVLVHSSFREDLELPDNFELLEDPARPVSTRTLGSLQSTLQRLEVDVLHSLFPLAPLLWRGKLAITIHDLQPLTDRATADSDKRRGNDPAFLDRQRSATPPGFREKTPSRRGKQARAFQSI